MFQRLDEEVPNIGQLSDGGGSPKSLNGAEAARTHDRESFGAASDKSANLESYHPEPTDVPSAFADSAGVEGASEKDNASSESGCPEPLAAPPPCAAGAKDAFRYSKTTVPTHLDESGCTTPEPVLSSFFTDTDAIPTWEGMTLEQLNGLRDKMLSLLSGVSEAIRREEVKSPSSLGPSNELTDEEKQVVDASLQRLLVEAFEYSSLSDIKEMYLFAKAMQGKEASRMGAALQSIHRLTSRGNILISYKELQDFLRSSNRFTADWRDEFVSSIKRVLAAFLSMSHQPDVLNCFYPQLLVIARHEIFYTVLLRAAQGKSVLPQSLYHLSPEWLAATHSCKCTLQQLSQSLSNGTSVANMSLTRNSQCSTGYATNPARRPYIDSSMRWNPPRVRPRVPLGASPRMASCDSSVDRNQYHTEYEGRWETPTRPRRTFDMGVRRQMSTRSTSALLSSLGGKSSGAMGNTAMTVTTGRKTPLTRTRSNTAGMLTRTMSAVRHMDSCTTNYAAGIKIGSKPAAESPLKLQRTATQRPSGALTSVKPGTKIGQVFPSTVRVETRSRARDSYLVTPRK